MKYIGSALIAVCLLATQAQAAEQYWVAVASFGSESAAQAGAQRLSRDIAEPLSVHGSQTGVGYRYRVLAGPYADRSAAKAAMEQARAGGVLDAWVFADVDGSVQASSVVSASYEGAQDTSLYGDDYQYEPLPETETYPTWQQQSEADSQEDRQLVEEPPPGYRLHRLRRDG